MPLIQREGIKTLSFNDRAAEETEELVHRQRTELDAQNQRLRQYRDRYVDLYDSAPVGYATLDGGGHIREINLTGARMLNADRDSLAGYPFVDCVAKEDQKAFLDHVRQCVQEHRKATADLALVARKGRSVIVQLRSVPGDGPEGQVGTCCRTAIIDITERRRMEETIRQSQAFLQTVIDSIPDPMLVIDREHRTVLANGPSPPGRRDRPYPLPDLLLARPSAAQFAVRVKPTVSLQQVVENKSPPRRSRTPATTARARQGLSGSSQCRLSE